MNKLFLSIRFLDKLGLNDRAGNQKVFSLRKFLSKLPISKIIEQSPLVGIFLCAIIFDFSEQQSVFEVKKNCEALSLLG